MDLNIAIEKIEKIIKCGKIFSVAKGEIFFCIYSENESNIVDSETTASGTSNISRNAIDDHVGKHFSKYFNTRFSNMTIDIKVDSVRVEKVGQVCNSKVLSDLINHYWSNPTFIYLENSNNNSNNTSEIIVYVRLYSLPKEWSTMYNDEETHIHTHPHTHTHSELESHTHSHAHTHKHSDIDVDAYNHKNYH